MARGGDWVFVFFISCVALTSCATTPVKNFYDSELEAEGRAYLDCLALLDRGEKRIREENDGYVILHPYFSAAVEVCARGPRFAAGECFAVIDGNWELALKRKYDEEVTGKELARLKAHPEQMKEVEVFGPSLRESLHLSELAFVSVGRYLEIEEFIKRRSDSALTMVMGERRGLAAGMHFLNRGEIGKARVSGGRVMGWRGRRWGMCGDVKG